MATKMQTLTGAAALLCALAMLAPEAQAEDRDKRALFNTFYLQAERGAYVLELRPNRSFHLTAPSGEHVHGSFHASDKEIGLVSSGAARHFRYWFDYQGNLTFRPTSKDHPAEHQHHRDHVHAEEYTNALGLMAPLHHGESATFLAAHNHHHGHAHGPVVVPPARPGFDRWDRDRNGRDRNDRWDRDDRNDRDGRFDRAGRPGPRAQRVLVEPARTERRWVPAVTETRRGLFGGTYTVVVKEGCWETVSVPARYEERPVVVARR